MSATISARLAVAGTIHAIVWLTTGSTEDERQEDPVSITRDVALSAQSDVSRFLGFQRRPDGVTTRNELVKPKCKYRESRIRVFDAASGIEEALDRCLCLFRINTGQFCQFLSSTSGAARRTWRSANQLPRFFFALKAESGLNPRGQLIRVERFEVICWLDVVIDGCPERVEVFGIGEVILDGCSPERLTDDVVIINGLSEDLARNTCNDAGLVFAGTD